MSKRHVLDGLGQPLLIGAVVLVVAMPWLSPQAAEGEPALWWAARAFGFVAYIALWCSMLAGLMVSAQSLGGLLDKKLIMELHQQWTLAGTVATLLHVLAVVTHSESGVSVSGGLVPFASTQLTAAVGIGTVAFWVLALVAVTSWLRASIPYVAWRVVHGLAFSAFVLALGHSVLAGTDTDFALVRWLYVITGAMLAGATVTRLLVAVLGLGPRRQVVPPRATR